MGVRDVVISPGSRSTPLALIMLEHPQLTTHMLVDERSASFFALGIAKATHRAVVLVCTSGTATTNYFSAVVEARYSRVPLIVLTADRPPELREVGAPQAIDQTHLYGHHAKWFVDMALPEDTTPMLRYASMMATRAVTIAESTPAAAVQINFPLREPLIPQMEIDTWEKVRTETEDIYFESGTVQLNSEQLHNLRKYLEPYKKGLIVCGDMCWRDGGASVTNLATALQYPILADPLSNLRSGTHNKEYVIDAYDALLKNEEICAEFVPDVIIRFGAMPVSKPFLLLLKKYEVQQIVIDPALGFRDPVFTTSHLVQSDEVEFCKKMIGVLEPKNKTNWCEQWQMCNEVAKKELLHLEERLFDGRVFLELLELTNEETILFVGNSMPIRDADTFFMNNEKKIMVLANRGANGIDGVVSSALGATRANKRTILVIGDLSFYHDLNGLLVAKIEQLNITIILMNNNGGGIFSFLPQATEAKYFEETFGTPLHLDFSHTVAMYSGTFVRVTSWDDFRKSVTASFTQGGLHVIEVPTIRSENVIEHRRLWGNVSESVKKVLKDSEN